MPLKFHNKTEPSRNNSNKLTTTTTIMMMTLSFIGDYRKPMHWQGDNRDNNNSQQQQRGIPSPGVEEEDMVNGEDILGEENKIVLVKAARRERMPRVVALPLESLDACTLGD